MLRLRNEKTRDSRRDVPDFPLAAKACRVVPDGTRFRTRERTRDLRPGLLYGDPPALVASSAEALAGHARSLALNAVFARTFWAARFALAESWGLASRHSPVAEELGAERSVVPAVQVAECFAVPEVLVANAPRKMAA